MRRAQISAFELAQRFVGTREVEGRVANPQILAMLKLDGDWPQDDSVPWCSAFVNYVAWMLRLPRSKSLRARSWLNVGEVIDLADAEAGMDVVVFSRGKAPQPGPRVLDAAGHVGWFAGREGASVLVLGGNQGDQVSVAPYKESALLGCRRLA